ncbi:MAG: hypothetical protein AAGN66_14290 [Acidobacteriota bacterium]
MGTAVGSYIRRTMGMVFLAALVWATAGPPAYAHSGTGDEAAVVVATAADGDRLTVTLDWLDSPQQEWLDIVVFDSNGAEIGSRLELSAPGERAQFDFDPVFSIAQTSGLQLTVGVREPGGGQARAASHPFRLALDCPGPALPCTWRTIDGLFASSVTVSGVLLAEIATYGSRGTTDLLADLARSRPTWLGQITTLAAQLDRMGMATPSPRCICIWIHGTEIPSADWACEEDFGESTDRSKATWETARFLDPGAMDSVSGQTWTTPFTPPHGEPLELGQSMKRICFQVVGKEVRQVAIRGVAAPVSITSPKLIFCGLDCPGEVRTVAELGGFLRVGGISNSSAWNQIHAHASIAGSLTLEDLGSSAMVDDDWTRSMDCAGADCSMPVEEKALEGENAAGGAVTLAPTSWGRATLSNLSQIDVKAWYKQWAYAAAHTETIDFSIEAEASCAPEEKATARYEAQRPPSVTPISGGGSSVRCPCGELPIDPWDKVR